MGTKGATGVVLVIVFVVRTWRAMVSTMGLALSIYLNKAKLT